MKKLLNLTLVISILLGSLLSPTKAFADGIMLPHGRYPIYEAEQKAAIFYQDGIENLVLSVRFTGRSKEDFGWIVPTPAKPEVEKGDEAMFRKLADMTVLKKNLLEKIKGEDNYYGIMEAGFGMKSMDTQESVGVEVIEEKQVGILDIAVLQADKVQDLLDWMEENEYNFPKAREFYRDVPESGLDEDVIIQDEKKLEVPEILGDDEIVISAELSGEGDSQKMVSPSYDNDVDIKQIIKDYIDEGWYFILAKVNPEFIDDDPVYNDYYYHNRQSEVTPLRISFETPDVVYPLRISAGGLNDQSILLYVFDDHKLRVSNYDDVDYWGAYEKGGDASQFETLYAENIVKKELYDLTRTVGKPSWFDPEKDMFLTKLHVSYLGYQDMTEDVLFEDTQDNKSVNAGDMSLLEWVQLPFIFLIYLPYNIIMGFGDFFSYGYIWDGFGAVLLVLSIAGLCFLISGFALFIMRKSKTRIVQKLMQVLLFPAVYALSVCASLVPVVIFSMLFERLGVREEVIIIDVFMIVGMLSTGLTMLCYKLGGRLMK